MQKDDQMDSFSYLPYTRPSISFDCLANDRANESCFLTCQDKGLFSLKPNRSYVFECHSPIGAESYCKKAEDDRKTEIDIKLLVKGCQLDFSHQHYASDGENGYADASEMVKVCSFNIECDKQSVRHEDVNVLNIKAWIYIPSFATIGKYPQDFVSNFIESLIRRTVAREAFSINYRGIFYTLKYDGNARLTKKKDNYGCYPNNSYYDIEERNCKSCANNRYSNSIDAIDCLPCSPDAKFDHANAKCPSKFSPT